MKLLIKNAQIATSDAVTLGDVLIEKGKISRIDSDISQNKAKIIDAAGKYLLPGGIDAHTHFDLDTGAARTSDDFFTGSVAAACGGTTTIIDHLGFGPQGCQLEHQVNVYHELAKNTVIDYGFHGVIQHVDQRVLTDMERLIEKGITSYKFYLTYGFQLHDSDIMRVLEQAQKLGIIMCVHCEHDTSIQFLTKRLLDEGKKSPIFHAKSRPVECEAKAIWDILMMAAELKNAPVYIVHLSSALGLDVIRLARNQGQANIFAETCPQYLFFDESKYDDTTEGLKFIMSPPLRTKKDNTQLWQGLKKHDIDVVATDHCPFLFTTQKINGLGDFSRCPNGAPGVELRMALMFSEGFMKDSLSLPEVVTLCSTKPAQIFGLGSIKGDIKPGYDADLVLFDPEKQRTITHAMLHEHTDYTPYEGITLTGAPVLTISRGEVIVDKGVFIGARGRGKYMCRQLSSALS